MGWEEGCKLKRCSDWILVEHAKEISCNATDTWIPLKSWIKCFLSFVTQLIVKIQIDWQSNCYSSGSLRTKLLPLSVLDWEPRDELLVILGDECGYSSPLFKSDFLQIISAIQDSIKIGILLSTFFIFFARSPNFIRNVSIEYCNPSWVFPIKYRQISNPKKKVSWDVEFLSLDFIMVFVLLLTRKQRTTAWHAMSRELKFCCWMIHSGR